MSALPNTNLPIQTDVLELRADEQRRRLHNSVVEFRSQVRDKLDVQKNARQHVWPASGAMAIVGLVIGYSFAGIFSRY